MRFLNSVVAIAALAVSGAFALPTQIGPAAVALRQVSGDVAVLRVAAIQAGKAIEAAIATSSDSVSAEVNAKVNANLQAIASATVQAATNIEADLSGAATQITAPEAKQLKADIELLVSLSTTLKQVILNTEQAEVSATNDALSSEVAAIIDAANKIVRPLERYIEQTQGIGGSGATNAVADLQKTSASIVASMKASIGTN